MKHTTPTLFAIDPRRLPVTNSTDKLFVRYNAIRSRIVSRERGFEVSVYDVLNTTTREGAYEVEFSCVNGRRLSGCNCRARVVCKHITRAVPLHVYRKECERRARATREVNDLSRWQAALA